jgi:hypothetical protein
LFQKFLFENYDEQLADVPRDSIAWNQWPSGTAPLTLKCSTVVCHINKGVDDDQHPDPYFRYYAYKEFIKVDIFEYSKTQEMLPPSLDKLQKYVSDFVDKHMSSMREFGIWQIYVTDTDTPKTQRADLYHAIVMIALKYQKTELTDDPDYFPEAVDGTVLRLDNSPNKIVMDYIMSKYPENPLASVIFPELPPKSEVRFKKQYTGQGRLAIAIPIMQIAPRSLDTANKLVQNRATLHVTADTLERNPTTMDEEGTNILWGVRKFLEYIFRRPRALRPWGIHLIEFTKIVEHENIQVITTRSYKANIFRLHFIVELTYLTRTR